MQAPIVVPGKLIEYNVSGPTLARFHADDHFIRIIRGPVRSGSSVACANELFKQACEQNVWGGKRKSRFAVVRNTYRELEDTTMKTWKDWFPEEIFGLINKNEMTHYIKFNDVECEVLFRALDKPEDIKKLLSLELTGAWLNEMREIPQAIFNTLTERVGQYPAKNRGGVRHVFIIGDTNSPDTDNYLYELAEEMKPDNMEFFHQPGALIENKDGTFSSNPLAENVHNLNEGKDYYLKRLGGKKKGHIRVYYCNQYGYIAEGKPVHEDYVDSTHCADKNLSPTPGLPITIGIDFGLTPAAAFGQKQTNGRWLIFDELVSTRMGIKRFCEALKPMLLGEYKEFLVDHIYCDPAGSQEAQTDEQTPFEIMIAAGIPGEPAYHNNDPIIRRESLDAPLTRMIDGGPGFLLSPKCKVLRKALMGGYCLKRMQLSGEARFQEKPMKNKFSHIAEACEYLMVGSGEGEMLIQIKREEEPEPDRIYTQAGEAQGWML